MRIYVPIFFILSLYFSYHTIISKNIGNIKSRFERLLIPYFIWPIAFFIIRNFVIAYYNNNKYYKLKDLISQMIIGFGIENIFWFQFNLILSHLIFVIIVFWKDKNYLFLIQLIGILSFIFFSSNYHYEIFSKYHKCIRQTIGLFFRILISSSIGFSSASIINIKFLEFHRKKSFFFAFVILYLFKTYFIPKDNNTYFDFIIFNFCSVCLIIIFFLFPFDFKTKIKISFFIKYVTNYTNGIYCLHPKIRDLLCNDLKMLKHLNIKKCIIIYLICYMICFIGKILFRKNKLKYLFI